MKIPETTHWDCILRHFTLLHIIMDQQQDFALRVKPRLHAMCHSTESNAQKYIILLIGIININIILCYKHLDTEVISFTKFIFKLPVFAG